MGGPDAKQPISAVRVSGLPGNEMCNLAVGYSKVIERFKLILCNLRKIDKLACYAFGYK